MKNLLDIYDQTSSKNHLQYPSIQFIKLNHPSQIFGLCRAIIILHFLLIKKKIYPQICQFQRRTNYSFVAINSLSQHERKNSCIKLWLLPLLDTYPFAPSFWNILMTYSLSRSFSFPADLDLSCSIIPLLHDMDIYFGKIPSRKCIKNLIKF